MRSASQVLLAIGAATAAAADRPAEPHCYDAMVEARILSQTPTLMPECDDGCIIIRWPWILDMKVKHVLAGQAPKGLVTVLNLQHTYFSVRHTVRWYFRRNTLGLFNLVGRDDAPQLCAGGTPPARPYIDPGPHRTLDGLRHEGEARYGKHG